MIASRFSFLFAAAASLSFAFASGCAANNGAIGAGESADNAPQECVADKECDHGYCQKASDDAATGVCVESAGGDTLPAAITASKGDATEKTVPAVGAAVREEAPKFDARGAVSSP